MAEIEKRFQEASALLEKADFIEALKKVETDEECQKLFADNGVELSLEDIAMMVKESAAASEDGELTEKSLDAVSGGVIGCFIAGTALIAFFSGYGYRAFTKYR